MDSNSTTSPLSVGLDAYINPCVETDGDRVVVDDHALVNGATRLVDTDVIGQAIIHGGRPDSDATLTITTSQIAERANIEGTGELTNVLVEGIAVLELDGATISDVHLGDAIRVTGDAQITSSYDFATVKTVDFGTLTIHRVALGGGWALNSYNDRSLVAHGDTPEEVCARAAKQWPGDLANAPQFLAALTYLSVSVEAV